jgi:hypothetical protein
MQGKTTTTKLLSDASISPTMFSQLKTSHDSHISIVDRQLKRRCFVYYHAAHTGESRGNITVRGVLPIFYQGVRTSKLYFIFSFGFWKWGLT